jgi:hypothetical protein
MQRAALLCLLAACGTDSTADDVADPATRTIALAMDSFTVEPGQEVWKCQDFANPFGADAQVTAWRAQLAAGSHHLLVTQIAGATDTAVTDCGQANLDGQVFEALASTSETRYPDGIAFQVPATSGFRLEAHYLNTTDAPITATVGIEADTDETGTERIAAGPLLFTTADISIPPSTTPLEIAKTCTVNRDMSLIDVVSHMHRRGIHFKAAVGDRVIYESDDYAEPERLRFATPLALVAGDQVTFSCTYLNTSSDTITFGMSADTDEMCALFGTYFPVPDGADPFLSCFVGGGPPPGQ